MADRPGQGILVLGRIVTMKNVEVQTEWSVTYTFVSVRTATKESSFYSLRKVALTLSRLGFAIFVISAFCVSSALPAATYEVDPNHSNVGFAVKHMLINTVRGKFKEFTGVIQMDEDDLTKSSVNVKIQAGTIDTGFARRDADLRGPDFLDIAKFPEITFVSTRIEKQGQNYVLVGNLTMHGIDKEVKIPFTYNGKTVDQTGRTRIGMEGTLMINRRDWGISYNKILDNGGLVAGNEVQIQLDVEAKKK
jgi:polyisoprenoid-binding protein YceI